MRKRREHRRTIGIAEAALDHLKTHELPATPRNFEFWYAYSAGFNRSLNRAVNAVLEEKGRITLDDVQRLHEVFLSSEHIGDRIEEIGGTASREIAALSEGIERILAETAEYGAQLANTVAYLGSGASKGGSAAALHELIEATQRIEDHKRALEARLAQSNAQFSALRTNIESIRYEATSDPLTTLSVRRHFDLAIQRAVDEAGEQGVPLSLILTDIDHFKLFNDRYGHQTGDHVLRLVAQSAKQNIKSLDIACRYGGEEFAIILRDATEAQAAKVGERIRQAVMARELVKRSTEEPLGHITISVGIATHRAGDTPQSIIERADACLYAAKRAGRNCVVSESRLIDGAARDVA